MTPSVICSVCTRAATRSRPPRSSTRRRSGGADTVPAATRGYDSGKKGNGRKRHIAVDTGGLLLVVLVTMAGIQDRDGGLRLLTPVRERFSTIVHVWADGGYAGVERTFAWIGKHRRCVRDDEILPEHQETMAYISMIMTMSLRLARTGDW